MSHRGAGSCARAIDVPLFAPEDLRPAMPPLTERFLALSRRPPRAPSNLREALEDENHRALERLRRFGAELARRFSLRYASLEAERGDVVSHYGICYRDGVIRIRLRHAKTGRLLRPSSLVDTLCHELAHLRHFDHSPAFKAFYLEILEEARRRGYYLPRRSTSLRQRRLFDPSTERERTSGGRVARAAGVGGGSE